MFELEHTLEEETKLTLDRSKIISDHMQRHTSAEGILVYFFANFAEPSTLQPVNIYRTMLKQLFLAGRLTEDLLNKVGKVTTNNIMFLLGSH